MERYNLDSISVKTPCNESWDEMSGNDEVRFCSHCAKSVHNLSAMSRIQVEELVRNSNGNLCVRYEKTPQGKPITALPKAPQIKRQSTIAAGVLVSSLALSTFAYAQDKPTLSKDTFNQPQKENATDTRQTQSLSVISGRIVNKMGAAIQGANITLRNSKTQETRTALSDGNGFYEFKSVEPSLYQIEVDSSWFKKSSLDSFETFAGKNLSQNIVLEADETAVVGLIATDSLIEIESPESKPLDKIQPIRPTSIPNILKPSKRKNK